MKFCFDFLMTRSVQLLIAFWETQGPPLTTCLGCMG